MYHTSNSKTLLSQPPSPATDEASDEEPGLKLYGHRRQQFTEIGLLGFGAFQILLSNSGPDEITHSPVLLFYFFMNSVLNGMM